jgi:hypothetical protein
MTTRVRKSKKMPHDLSDIEYEAAMNELMMISELVESGVLGSELCPERYYSHWPVLKPELLPDWLQLNYKNWGEIRFYTE